ncbi:hypothetical protein [Pelomonas sp. KK5]|uniref:hypothetical protein n=1 Tax=Pelomonas sp. KK5 TaxID=1855730 RepID=UPI00117EF27F|nr:hypothetical protein [Pelomonas sp. KK5]
MRPLLLTVILSGIFLAGCAGPERGGHRMRPDETARVEALRAGAYRSMREAPLSLTLQRWIIQGEHLPVSLAFPAGGERGLPLIVYLPGLGESAEAGAQWRLAWARAGYAVLSVQPLEADERAWSSDLARSADFKGLARERQQPGEAAARLRTLQAVLAEAQRRAATGDPLWLRVDFSRLGLAGYELGTQTALAVQAQAPRLAISPLVSAADAGVPVLLVGSRRDSDPIGLGSGPAARRPVESFEQQSRGYLLMLGGATHTALSGSGGEDPEAMADRVSHMPMGGRGRRQAAAPEQLPPGAPDDSSVIAIEASSTAFWDATLRAEPGAQAWLQREAGPWLRGLAEWEMRRN